MLALLGVSAAAAAAVPILTVAVGAGPVAPDLRADPVRGVTPQPEVAVEAVNGGQARLLVRFDGFVTNVGQGPLEVSGNPQITSPTNSNGVRQRASSTVGGPADFNQVVGRPTVIYEAADGHNHFHLKNAMRYSLWNSARSAEAAPGSKVGFCLYDIEGPDFVPGAPVQTPNAVYTQPVTEFCDQGHPESIDLKMGVSPGWRDLYDKSLPYQWVDVSNTQPGEYYVASEADPDNVLWEGNGDLEVNARAFSGTKVTIPGWVPQEVSTPQTGAAKDIALQASKFGSQSNTNLRFKIVDPPDHGTLDETTNALFADAPVRYTPQAGYSGPDSFRYQAIYNGYGFPLNPPSATVSLTSGTTQSVAISGAPASMIAGTSAQLSASLSNLSGGVVWSTTGGSVSQTGLVTAPASAGSITVTAASAAVPSVATSVTIGVAATPPQIPAPGVNVKSPGVRLLSNLGTGHIGKRIIVGKVIVGPKSGRLIFTATINKKILGRCNVKAPARRGVTCKIVLKRNYPLTKVKMTAQLKFAKSSVVRRAFVVR